MNMSKKDELEQTYSYLVKSHLYDSMDTKERVVRRCTPSIILAAKIIAKAFSMGNKVLLCGNGGSAADCQHIAAEFVNLLTLKNERPALPAIALTTDTSILTAAANDFGYDKVFVRPIQALGKPGDVLIGITTSGNSANVLSACAAARLHKMKTLVLTGSDGKCYSDGNVDVIIGVPSEKTQHIQEAHITIGHILCELVETMLYPLKETK